MKCGQSLEYQSALGKAFSLDIGKGIQEGLVVGVEHGKAVRDLKDTESYDLGVEARYVIAIKDLESVSFPLLDDLEALKDSPIALNGFLDFGWEGGSGVFDSWDHETLLSNALTTSRARCENKKKDASLDLVTFAVAVVSQPNPLAPSLEELTTDALVSINVAPSGSVTTTLVPVIDRVVTSSAPAVVVSQDPSIAIVDYQISYFIFNPYRRWESR
nr:hypothetical protein [Tanacetum cinerariifolium]